MIIQNANIYLLQFRKIIIFFILLNFDLNEFISINNKIKK